jgi:hypothetical protein
MDDLDRRRLNALLQRQTRLGRTPRFVAAWREHGVPVTAMNDERSEYLISWVREHWRQPDELISDLEPHLQLATEGHDVLLVLDFWSWDTAVALLVPTIGLRRTSPHLRKIYPDGFMVVDQALSRAMLVDFDDAVSSTAIAEIGPKL